MNELSAFDTFKMHMLFTFVLVLDILEGCLPCAVGNKLSDVAVFDKIVKITVYGGASDGKRFGFEQFDKTVNRKFTVTVILQTVENNGFLLRFIAGFRHC